MAIRFRRTINLFPGVRLNLSKGGVSISIGKRGVSVTMGPRGLHLNLGVPGTGLSHRSKLGVAKGRPVSAQTKARSENTTEPFKGNPSNTDRADPKLSELTFEYSLTDKRRLEIIDKGTGKTLLGPARQQHFEAHEDQVDFYLKQQAEKLNAQMRAITTPHLVRGARDPQATLLTETLKLPEPPSEKLLSSRPLYDGRLRNLLRSNPTQARYEPRVVLRKEILAAMPTEEQLGAWHAYSKALTALRGEKYALRKDLLQCSEAAFIEYVGVALNEIRWPISISITPTAVAVGQKILLTYDVTLPDMEAIPVDEFEIDLEELSLVSKVLGAEKCKELWRDYAMTVVGTLLTISFNLTTRIVQVDVSAGTTETWRTGQSSAAILKASVGRSQFEWEHKGLFAEK
jgi:hypothetical protein